MISLLHNCTWHSSRLARSPDHWMAGCAPGRTASPVASINFDSIGCFHFVLISAEEDFIMDKFINPSKPAEIEIEKDDPVVVSIGQITPQ